MEKQLYLVTGIMAAGKSTVSELLAGSLPRCVHVRGDVFRRMVVSGREEMSEAPSAEALRQLHLRYRLAAQTAKAYYDAGFSVVLQDNYYGAGLTYILGQLKGYPVQTTVLCPRADVVQRREQTRGKTGYTGFSVESLHSAFMQQTPRVGYWLDNSEQTPRQTADAILRHFAGAGTQPGAPV